MTLQTHDVTETCQTVQAVVRVLLEVVRKNGLPPPVSVARGRANVREHLERREYFSALRSLIAVLEYAMAHAVSDTLEIEHYYSKDSIADLFFTVSEHGTVANEHRFLWKKFPLLASILPQIKETELFGSLFYDLFEREPCNFATARESMPALVLSCNRPAIQAAVNIIKAVEPFSDEVVQAEARVRQLELDERAGPVESMSGQQFEELLGRQFAALGFTVKGVGGSGDYGADLLLTAREGTVIAVQAKRWKSRVNLKAVQEVHGSLSYYSADLGIVVSSAGFYPSARELAARSGVELWDKSKLALFLAGQLTFSSIAPLANPQAPL